MNGERTCNLLTVIGEKKNWVKYQNLLEIPLSQVQAQKSHF